MLRTAIIALLAIASFAALPHVGFAQTRAGDVVDLHASPHGRAAAAFIAAINDGSAKACQAFEETYRAQSQRHVSGEERAARFAALHADFAPITMRRVSTAPDGQLTVETVGRDGQRIVMEFIPDAASAERIEGVRMEVGGSGIATAPISAADLSAAVNAAAKALEDGYVFPEIGRKMATSLRDKHASGGFAGITDDRALAQALTHDLQALSKDLHLSIHVRPREDEAGESRVMPGPREMAANNYAFRKVEILPGNIGYIRFDLFVPGPEAETTAAAAMAFVRNCDSVIFDLRHNGGGSPEMIRFITSYLFAEPVHLNDMVDRNGKVISEYWTLESVPGERLRPNTPVYVLTSRRTFSGAEEFSYNLKNLGRAKIIGERTGGGAHPVRPERLSERLVVRVPYLRARNPISKTNWDGVGVEPDIEVPADEALDRATRLAREGAHEGPAASR